ncbi:MAG: hypothetical protein J1F67_03725 [Muribaculaceae bacterium]|nr:hypothetical protein [Muribaculaceae bacterium]
MITYLGNQELLKWHKIAFFASSKTKSNSVLPTLDWATEIAKREDVAVCSGFQSPLEMEILPYLLKGKCGIIIGLNRGIYKKTPQKFLDAYNSGRILFISLQNDNIIMPSKANAEKRNLHLASIADEIVFSSLNPRSSLFSSYITSTKSKQLL